MVDRAGRFYSIIELVECVFLPQTLLLMSLKIRSSNMNYSINLMVQTFNAWFLNDQIYHLVLVIVIIKVANFWWNIAAIDEKRLNNSVIQ